MRIRPLAALALTAVVAACAPAGYYDSTGVYHSYGASDSYRTDTVRGDSPAPGGNPDPDRAYYAHPAPASTTTVIYDRPGYYDYNGAYVETDAGPSVPHRMLPPQGLCRVWFSERPVSEEPPVESCNGIQHRVPEGAYVIYGG